MNRPLIGSLAVTVRRFGTCRARSRAFLHARHFRPIYPRFLRSQIVFSGVNS